MAQQTQINKMASQASALSEPCSVAVVGARGYSGLELARLLLRHPHANLVSCYATGAFRLSDYLPEEKAEAIQGRPTEELFQALQARQLQVVFLATPPETSLDLTPKFLEAGVHVIDLSGAFRLQNGSLGDCASTYQKWYNFQHTSLALLKEAEFGLVPWVGSPKSTGSARLVSNPGCFATAVLMGLLPLLKERLVDAQTLVIDAKSGTSGAGRKAEERLLHCEVDGLCLPYRIGRHQHEPEIQQLVSHYAGVEIQPFFTTHLLNVRRGIVASMYARLMPSLMSCSVQERNELVAKAFQAAYHDYPLVNVASLDHPGGESLLNLRRVVGSARTHISYRIVEDRLYVFSMIDNLLKGAASQAIENFNRIIGVPQWTGLADVEGVL